MRRSKGSWRSAAAGLALLALSASCTPSVQTGDPNLLPSSDASRPPNTPPPTGVSAPQEPSPTPTPTRGDEGTLEFRVKDSDGTERPGVRVRYDGPASGTVVTGRRGVARVEVPAGSYAVEVPVGCVEDLEVFRGSRAAAVVYPDTRSVVRLRGIDARAAIWLSNPSVWDSDPPWQIGDRVEVTATVVNRCRSRPAPGGTSVAWLRWQASPAIEITSDEPRRSDRDATVSLSFRCVARGTASLIFRDPVTDEREDLLRVRRSFDVVEPTCG